MQTNNVKINTVKLPEKIEGFQSLADLKRPELGDIYISSEDGYLRTWGHSNKGKAIKVVLRPLVTVDVKRLPTGLLVCRAGMPAHFISTPDIDLKNCTLSDKWQANTYRNCPFKKGTVEVEVKVYNGAGDGWNQQNRVQDATSFRWSNVAQFRVIKLCEGVEYKTESDRSEHFSRTKLW